MIKFNKKLTNSISQAGSLMIEAMAMLALISLVTPTLYKKSAERTSELQDINTATHMRTLIKAVDNYVASNYDELLQDIGDGGYKNFSNDDIEKLKDYLPYGYDITTDVKNFGAPKIALHRQTNGITSYVELPKKTDIGAMRAARIASMVGSNGGFVNGENAEGVGGIWSLDKNILTNDLKFSGAANSIVVTSAEAVTSSTSSALENDKYLQRTKVDSPNQIWRNTMATDLYMGGVSNGDTSDTNDMHKILGVDQLIIGSTTGKDGEDVTHNDGLVITGAGDDGSAWIEESLSVGANLTSGGDTDLATNDGSFFRVGYDNTYVPSIDVRDTTDGNGVVTGTGVVTFRGDHLILDGNKNSGNHYTTINSLQTNINSPVSIGSDVSARGYSNPSPDKHEGLNPQLHVKGNAYVDDTLYSKKIETPEFDTLTLKAGGDEFGDSKHRWLHATGDGVTVKDTGSDRLTIDADKTTISHDNKDRLTINADKTTISHDNQDRLTIDASKTTISHNNQDRLTIDAEHTILSNGDGTNTSLEFYSRDAYLNGGDSILINTDDGGLVSIQNELLTAQDGTVNIGDGNPVLSVKTTKGPWNDKNLINMDAENIYADDDGNFAINPVQTKDGISSNFRIAPKSKIDKPLDDILIDENGLRVQKDNIRVLEVDNGAISKKDNNLANKGSVYIRQGAIELQKSTGTDYAANEGYGYVEASRFVANNDEKPDYINNDSTAWQGTNPDVYMVNPAYTSVMHDIKLTTRGGARLSDILPDFINKGIYVVNNTYKEGCWVTDDSKATVTNGHVSINNNACTEVANDSEWTSPYLGMVPAPQCPPGYAKVITVTPAGFMMAQAGNLKQENDKWYVDDTENLKNIAAKNWAPSDGIPPTVIPSLQTKSLSTTAGVSDNIYFIGFADEKKLPEKTGYPQIVPTPLYFQQSNWLKSKVIPKSDGGTCTSNKCDNFVGWATIMGFLYSKGLYGNILDILNDIQSIDSNAFYWNIFPVRAKTLEAYATVYCYFDRKGMYTGSSVNKSLVDQYDQLNSFKSNKDDNYIERLNDPTLKYNSAW